MILDRQLKKLQVGVRVGGSLISHRVLFSRNSKYAYVICNDVIQIYSTKTGFSIGEIQSPNSETITNATFIPPSPSDDDNDDEGEWSPNESQSSSSSTSEILIILTTTGLLAHVDCRTRTTLTVESINASLPKDWSKISEWIHIQCIQLDQFLIVGRIGSADEEVMLYHVQRYLPSTYKNKNKKYSFFEFEKLCWKVQANTHSVCFGNHRLSPGTETETGDGVNGEEQQQHQQLLIAAIQDDDSVFVMDFHNKISKWHKSGTRKFTVVAAHPTDWMIATGDDSGRIVLWNNIFDKSPTKTVFHWHTLPVADLCFSIEGTQLISGGGECTLVKWDLNHVGNKRTLPRMGLPIRHISVSAENEFYGISHADNTIQLVNSSTNEIETRIQNITQCYMPSSSSKSAAATADKKYFQAGLHVNPRNSSLVLNGKPGHLQCYSFREDKHLYNMDITQQNYITDERHKSIPSIEVTHVAFSGTGKWMATGESLETQSSPESSITSTSTSTCLQLRVKFWEFSEEQNIYLLNTSIDWPHELGLHGLKIQTGVDYDDNMSLMAASSGKDKLFKTWGIVCDNTGTGGNSSVHDKRYWWNCENVGSYRDLPAGPLAFSRDGSVLAVAFSHTLTLWITDNHELRGSLSHVKLQEELRMIEFGCHMSSNLVICCSSTNIIIWDVITLTLSWTLPFDVESLAVDPLTNVAAVFSTKKHVYFFRPDQPVPLAIHKNVSRSEIISSLFVPNTSSHQQQELNSLKSSLVFMNASQELCVFLSGKNAPTNDDDHADDTRAPGAGAFTKSKSKEFASTLTPFGQLIPERIVSEVGEDSSRKKKSEEDELGGGLLTGPSFSISGFPGSKTIRELIDASPHTMPSVTFFCDQLLSAVSIPRKSSDKLSDYEKELRKSYKNKISSNDSGSDLDSEEDGEEEESDDEDDEEQQHRIRKPSPTKIPLTNKKPEPEAIKQNQVDRDRDREENFDIDLDEVSTENTSWIQSIFSTN